MPTCPHCGETVRPAQERCFACGQQIRARRAAGRRPVNPLVFIIAGVALAAAVVGILVAIPKHGKEKSARAERAELERVQDSLRRANREVNKVVSTDKEADRLNGELAELESRFETVQRQTVGASPTPEQAKLINQIKSGLTGLRQQVQMMTFVAPQEKAQAADSVRARARRVRGLISDLTRAPKK